MKEEKHYNMFTCDRCGQVKDEEIVMIVPDGWKEIIFEDKHYYLCDTCYTDFFETMSGFFEELK